MPTPEGAVKEEVKKALIAAGVHPYKEWLRRKVVQDAAGFFYMPVAGPMAVHGVHDFVGCWHGVFWSMETKAVENPVDATPHQELFQAAVTAAGGISLTGVRGPEAVAELQRLVLQRVRELVR